jgi:hypothetical protein
VIGCTEKFGCTVVASLVGVFFYYGAGLLGRGFYFTPSYQPTTTNVRKNKIDLKTLYI